jgi:hypothetical protein
MPPLFWPNLSTQFRKFSSVFQSNRSVEDAPQVIDFTTPAHPRLHYFWWPAGPWGNSLTVAASRFFFLPYFIDPLFAASNETPLSRSSSPVAN